MKMPSGCIGRLLKKIREDFDHILEVSQITEDTFRFTWLKA